MTEAAFDPVEAIRALRRNGVRYVLIGGLAGSLRGSPVITGDVDICYARDDENLVRLAKALTELRARLRGVDEGVPFILDARTLRNGDSFTFHTDAGRLDVLGTPAGTGGFEDLDRDATEEDLGEGVSVRVASLDDLMRMKRASGRSKDVQHLEHLAALRDELEGRPPP
jgi:hypothetical protein